MRVLHASGFLLGVLLVALATPLAVPTAAAQCTTSWINAAGGNWNADSNWSNGVPDSADDACITLAGTYTVAIGIPVNPTARSLTLGGTSGTQTLSLPYLFTLTLLADSQISAHGVLDWTGGTITMSPSAVLTNRGLIRISSMNEYGGAFSPGHLVNEGTVTWVSGRLTLRDGSTIDNRALFDVGGDVRLWNSGYVGNAFINASTAIYRKSAGAGTHAVGVPLTNRGLVDAQQGAIALQNATTQVDAVLTASAGASVVFDSNLHTVVGTLRGNPSGSVRVDGGAALDAADTATLDLGGMGLEWTGGNLNEGQFTNVGLLRFTGGVYLVGVTTRLINEGSVEWTSGDIGLNNGGVIINKGLFEVRGNSTLRTTAAELPFVNATGGLFRKSASGGETNVLVTFINESGGVVSAESGRINFHAPLHNRLGGLLQGTSPIRLTIPTIPTIPTGPAVAAMNYGDVGPGTSTGTLPWAGPYTPKASSRLIMEIAGLTAGTHDVLQVSGGAALRGMLDVRFLNGYTPAVGDAFTILTAAAVTGAFDVIRGPAGFSYDVTYTPTSVVLTLQPGPTVEVTAAPEPSPIMIPSVGGPVRFGITLTNMTAQAQSVQQWIEAILPDGTVHGPLFGPLTVTLGPGQTMGPVLFQRDVPALAPAGPYVVRARVGTYPGAAIDEDAFTFEKSGPKPLPTGDEALSADVGMGAAGREEALTVNGPGVAPVVGGASLHPVHPNPFASRTTLQYDLPVRARVRLSMFDVLGREVAVLVDGELEAGRHEATLDGSTLPAGTYLVRLEASGEGHTRTLTLVR